MSDATARSIERRIEALSRRVHELEVASAPTGGEDGDNYRLFKASGMNVFCMERPAEVNWSAAPSWPDGSWRVLAGARLEHGAVTGRQSSAVRFGPAVVPRGKNNYHAAISCRIAPDNFRVNAGSRFSLRLQGAAIVSDYDGRSASWENWSVVSVWAGLGPFESGSVPNCSTGALRAWSIYPTAPKQFIMGGLGYVPDTLWSGPAAGRPFNLAVPVGRCLPPGTTVYAAAFTLEAGVDSNCDGVFQLLTDGNICLVESDFNLQWST